MTTTDKKKLRVLLEKANDAKFRGNRTEFEKFMKAYNDLVFKLSH